MIDYQRVFHTGVLVPDLDAAMAELGEALGLTWAQPTFRPDQQTWSPEAGAGAVPLRYVYSCEGPQHIELLQGPPGSIWDGTANPGVHHVGVWADDVAAATNRLVDVGWRLMMAKNGPDDGYGSFTYLRPPGGMLVELVDAALLPRFERWWAGGEL